MTPNLFGWLGAFHNGTQEYGEMVSWLQEHKVGEKLKLNIFDVKHGTGYIKIGRLLKPKEWEGKTENEIVAEISPFRNVVDYRLY